VFTLIPGDALPHWPAHYSPDRFSGRRTSSNVSISAGFPHTSGGCSAIGAKAAVFLLSVETDKVRKILEGMSNRPGVFGFSMSMTLKEWDKGKLTDYPD
jgi:hypothetical protein